MVILSPNSRRLVNHRSNWIRPLDFYLHSGLTRLGCQGQRPSISTTNDQLKKVRTTTKRPSAADIFEGRFEGYGTDHVGGDQDFQPEQERLPQAVLVIR